MALCASVVPIAHPAGPPVAGPRLTSARQLSLSRQGRVRRVTLAPAATTHTNKHSESN